MRRLELLVVGIFVFVLAGAGVTGVRAQVSEPVEAEALGLPELTVTVDADGYEVSEDEVAAGRYLVTLENTADEELTADFVQLPAGFTEADFGELLDTPSDLGEGLPPNWFYEVTMAGGTDAFPDEVGQTVLDLGPGEWIIWAGDPTYPHVPASLTVTGELATPGPDEEPESDVTIVERDHAFEAPETMADGPQTWKVVNEGTQPHFLALLRSPEPVTVDELLTLLAQPDDATPEAGLPNPDEFVSAGYAGTMSAGQTSWVILDLEPGTYFMICLVPDGDTGEPHATEGMIAVITVE